MRFQDLPWKCDAYDGKKVEGLIQLFLFHFMSIISHRRNEDKFSYRSHGPVAVGQSCFMSNRGSWSYPSLKLLKFELQEFLHMNKEHIIFLSCCVFITLDKTVSLVIEQSSRWAKMSAWMTGCTFTNRCHCINSYIDEMCRFLTAKPFNFAFRHSMSMHA